MGRDDAIDRQPAPAEPPVDEGTERAANARDDLTGPREAVTGAPDQDQTRRTGPGTGGATETATRMPRHSGAHVRNSAKG